MGCWTKNEEHTVIDDVPECQTVYEEKCHGEVKGYTTEEKCSKWPKEVCDLQPRTQCDHVTKLVPKLVPVEECVDVPKEVCNMVRGPGRKVLKPVTKEWCYTPSPESGLH